MDKISGLTTRSKLTSHSPKSKQEQPDTTNTPSGDIPPPQFLNSINELRSYSAALSAFLCRYDELHSHLKFINSSIDSKLPDHLVDATNPNQSALTRALDLETCIPDDVVSERSPNGSASDCEQSHAIARTPRSSFDEEIDTSKKPEVVDLAKNHEEIDVSIEIDTSNKREETDVSENSEEIDASEKHVETDDVLMKPEEIVAETSSDVTIAIVSEPSPNGIAATDCNQSRESVWTPKSPNGIATDCVESHETEEIDQSKKPEQTDILNKHEENFLLKQPEETDTLKKHEETVPEVIVAEQNPNGTATDVEQSHETVRTPEILEEIETMTMYEAMDISKTPEQTDIKPEEIDLLKKAEETDNLKNPENFDVLMKPEQTDICKNPEEIVILKKPEQIDTLMNPLETDASRSPEEINVSRKDEEPETSKKHEETGNCKKGEEINVSRKHEEPETSKKSIVSVLEGLCQSMLSKEMKRHVRTHLSEMNQLHNEIANALKLARNPASLVLECIGRFFVQNSKGFRKGAHETKENVRLASVLILECFVMISGDGIEIEERDQEYAAEAAVDWRKRMIREGGLRQRDEVDARGLLLLISGFGIQDHVFKIQDILDLIRASNVKGISSALRRSVFLVSKLPEVIDWMVKNNLEIEAADIAYTFKLENKCHPRNILVTYLHKKIRDIQYASSFQMLEALKQQLIDLNSVKQCLQSHNIDLSMLLPDFKIDEKIQNLEKEINEWKLIQKKPEQIDKHEENDLLKKPEQTDILKKPKKTDILKKHEEIDICKKPEQTDICKNPEETNVSRKHEEPETSKKSIVSVLESLCQRMRSKELKWHVADHLSEMNQLHKEIANALKLGRTPARLVLDGIGRFFVQSSKTFFKGTEHQIRQNLGRQASALILECFVMISSDGIKIAKKDQEYAAEVAVDWKKRMIKEGGLKQREEVDARGLLLLISGFGIQDHVFNIQDILDLIRASNVKGIATTLCHSVFLVPKIPEVIDWMVKNNLEIEAADMAYTFKLEDKCHPRNILVTYLHKKFKDIQYASSFQMLEALKQHLFDLNSVKQCLQSHNIDPSMLLPDFKIDEKIQNLEKEINEWKLIQKKPEEIDLLKKHEETGICKKGEETNVLRKHEEPETSKKSIVSVLESLCQRMRFKDMKWHVADHLSEMNHLHKEIANALKLARNPASLVLDGIGRFFVQGSKTFFNDTAYHVRENAGRLASVLILECFVMISGDGIEIEKQDQEYAALAAVDWRKRMIKEGGLRQRDEVDARGLLFLISGFGIQDHVFKIQDILDLIRASNVKGISTTLRRSVYLVPKIPEVIDWMVKNNLEIEAADMAYTFKLEDKCHPRNILVTYLHKKVRDVQYASSFEMLEALKQHLLDLNFVKQCLQSHNIDPSILLPDYNIDEKIQNLEKEISEWKSIQKRKSLESPIHHESKRACFSPENMPRQHTPVDHYGMNPYNRSAQPTTSYYDHDRNHCNIYTPNYSPSPVYNAPPTPDCIPGSYDQMMVHHANVRPHGLHEPYGQHYSRYGQTYDPQPHIRPHIRPWGRGPPAPGGFPGRRGPTSDLYHFADIVEKETRRLHAPGSNGA